jgi:hypothetical protein
MYQPKINDYVTWKDGIEGWVYFQDSNYITLEIYTRPKNPEDYQISKIHANNRVLMLCYQHQWNELTFVKSRNSIHE